jgi:hypothetical protein
MPKPNIQKGTPGYFSTPGTRVLPPVKFVPSTSPQKIGK